MLRQQLANKESQLENLRQQVGQKWSQVSSRSGWTASDIKARLFEEAEQARAEAEHARAEAEAHARELERAKQRLKTTYKAIERRNTQLETASQVAREAAGILNVGKLLETTVHLISDRFGFYQAAVFLLDESRKYAVLRAASWEGGKQLLARNYKLLVGYQGIVGHVAKTGEPRISSNESVAGDNVTFQNLLVARSEIALPLKVRDRVIGVLDVRSSESEAFTEEDVATLQTMADQVAVALDNARLFEQIKRHSRQLLTATEVSKSTMTILDPEKLMQHAASLIREGFDLHYVGVFLVDDDSTYAVLRAGSAKPKHPTLPTSQRIKLDTECAIGRCILQAKAFLSSNSNRNTPSSANQASTDSGTLPDTRSEMVLPLVTRGKAVGALTIQSLQEAAFLEKDIPVFQTMVDQIAIALDNARLFKETSEAKIMAKQAQQAAETANKAKSTFLANMSHELRTPLNAILGFTQLMTRDTTLTPSQQENLGTISRSGMHLLTLINDVLEMSKIEAGRTVLSEQSFDLHGMLDELESMFRLRALDKGLALNVMYAADVPQHIRADESKLRQVLINLLGNAVKFTETGEVSLHVAGGQQEIDDRQKREQASTDSPPAEERPDVRLKFEVADTGPGISTEDLKIIFDPFVQTLSHRDYTEGTGLGLPISQQFVRMMGGDGITAQSELGQGSLFKFDVHVGLADASEIQVDKPEREVVALQPEQQAPDGSPYRLLVVEDREANRRLLVKLLTTLGPPPQGFEVREATNGEEALAIWESWQPHLIWMDMRMPIMDGYETTRRIKAAPQGNETIIIALTASAFEEDRLEMLNKGCDDFVRKPFRNAEIFDKIAQHLGVRYIYKAPDSAKGGEPSKADTQACLTPSVLAALPSTVLTRLKQAAVETDMLQVINIISEIRPHDSGLADALEKLADDFEYSKIATLVQQARTGKKQRQAEGHQ